MSLRGEIKCYLSMAQWRWEKILKRRKRAKHEKIVKDPCGICGEPESVGYHDDCKIDHYLIIRSDGSLQLERELGSGADRGKVSFTLEADKNRESLMQGYTNYDPDGKHYPAADLHCLTWGEAKRIQTLLRTMYYERYENDL